MPDLISIVSTAPPLTTTILWWSLAIFFSGDARNISARLAGSVQTNERAQLTAVVLALQKVLGSTTTPRSVVIKNVNKYCVDGWRVWMHEWRANGWRTVDGAAVANLDLWTEFDECLDNCRSHVPPVVVRLELVEGQCQDGDRVKHKKAIRLAAAGLLLWPDEDNHSLDPSCKDVVEASHEPQNVSPKKQPPRKSNEATDIDFRVFHLMPVVMGDHWTRCSDPGEVSFSDFVHSSPPGVGAAIISTYSLGL